MTIDNADRVPAAVPVTAPRGAGRRAIAAIAGLAGFVLWAPGSPAGGYGYGYGYDYRFGTAYGRPYVAPGEDIALRNELARLRDQLRANQRQLEEQIRLQREQIRLLRQQIAAGHQVSAMQACYYRVDAGIETCGGLFEAGTAELDACRASVLEKNAACAPPEAPDG